MKIDISFLAAFFLIGTDLLTRTALQGVEQALVSTAIESQKKKTWTSEACILRKAPKRKSGEILDIAPVRESIRSELPLYCRREVESRVRASGYMRLELQSEPEQRICHNRSM